jgi:hypothetical protein
MKPGDKMSSENGTNRSSTGQKVYILIKQSKDDPPVPRVEVLDLDGETEGTWAPSTRQVEPQVVDKEKDIVITMREYVNISKTWTATGYDKVLCLTEYLAAAASTAERKIDWVMPPKDAGK